MKSKSIFSLILLYLISVTLFAQIPTNGLMAYYPFNGNANDLSGNNQNGTNYGATLTTDRFGQANAAYNFNGGYIQVPNSSLLNTTGEITMSAWVNLTNSSTDQKILSKHKVLKTGYILCVSTGAVASEVRDNNTNQTRTFAGSVTANNWAHIVTVWKSTDSMYHYVNGIKVGATKSVSGNIDNITEDLFIGKSSFGFPVSNGKIDDIRIYNRTLSSTEIKALFNECNKPAPTATISGNNSICNGNSTNLNLSLTGSSTWSATYTDGTTSVTITGITSSPYLISVKPTSNKTYTLTSVSDVNCTGTVSGSALVAVNNRPTAIISGTTPICNGASTNLSVALTGNPNWTFTYTDGTMPVTLSGITSSPYLISVKPTSNKTYTLTSVSDVNCTGTVSGSALVAVNNRPTAIISGTTPICNGNSTNLSVALSGTLPWSITYSDGSTSSTIYNITSSPYLISVKPTFTKTYTLTSVSDANCTGTVSGSAVVTVNAKPSASITGNSVLCNGNSTNLNVDFGVVSYWPVSPNWSITYTDGTTPVTITGITSSPYLISVKPTSNKTYTLTSVSDANCTGTVSGSALVAVNNRPTATISGNSVICIGASTNLSVALTGNPNWTITYTDGTTPVTISGITTSPYLISVKPTSSKTYSLTAVSDVNCTGTFSGTALVTVNAKPSASITGNSVLCNGNSTNLNVALNGSKPWSITYTDGTSPVTILGMTTSPYLISVNPTSNKTYTLLSVSDANCSGTVSGSATVTLNEKPNFADITKCYDTLSSVFNASSGYTNKWYNSNNTLIYSGNKFSTKVFNALGKDTTYKYFVSNFNGICESEKDTVVFNIKSLLPKPTFSDINKCYDTATYSFTATNGYTNNWYNSYNQLINTGTTFKTKLYEPFYWSSKKDTTYKYLVSNFNNICESDKDTVTFNVKGLPYIDFRLRDLIHINSYIYNNELVFANRDYPLSVITSPSGGMLKLNNKIFNSTIYDPKTNSLGKKNFTYSYTDPLTSCSNTINFTFIVFDTVRCISGSDTLVIKHNLTSGIDLPSDFGVVKLYPNPANDILNITYNNPSSSYRINIINSQSQTIYSNNLNINALQLSLIGFNKGLYLVQIIDINTDKVFQASKLVIE